ncbi:MAG: hypothetical protein U0R70_03615 [Solirubrobacteraceae bacterium]
MVGIIITCLVAAVAYILLTALGLPAVVGIIAAVLILLGGIPMGMRSGRAWPARAGATRRRAKRCRR